MSQKEKDKEKEKETGKEEEESGLVYGVSQTWFDAMQNVWVDLANHKLLPGVQILFCEALKLEQLNSMAKTLNNIVTQIEMTLKAIK